MKLLDFLYPPRCPLCGEILALNEGLAHRACYKTLVWVREPRCKRCGKPLTPVAGEGQELCMDCLRSRHRHGNSFDQGRALWLYSGNIQQSVLDSAEKSPGIDSRTTAPEEKTHPGVSSGGAAGQSYRKAYGFAGEP